MDVRTACAGMRRRWAEQLAGGTGFDPLVPEFAGIIARLTETADEWQKALRREESRTCLWDDLADWSSAATLTSNYKRIWDMTLACHTYGSPLYRQPELERDVIGALDWMHANHYYAAAEMYGNWWDWYIGVPLKLLDCMTLLYDRLNPRQRGDYLAAVDRFKPGVPPTSTGANRVWECKILALRGVLGEDGGKIAEASGELRPVFPYAAERDGFYRDGSYIQHDTHPYTGGYGQSLLQELSGLIFLLDGSPWEVEEADRQQVFRWIYDSYEPVMYRGLMMDMAMGRVASRRIEQSHDVGHIIVSSVIRLSRIAPPADAAALRSMAKSWIRANTRLDFYAAAVLDTAIEAKRIVEDAGVPISEERPRHYAFANMARSVHRRPGYTFAISMHSERISNYESINQENLRGWHTSDGMTYLYDGDLGQFSDGFWPTANSCRLPGTTVLRGTEVAANRTSDRQWAGGTSLLGRYGAAGMSLHPPDQSLTARKSWFLFDDEIAALGSGICAQDGIMAETVVENRMLNRAGSNALTVDGERQPDRAGWADRMDGVVWMHLQGNAEEAPGIGYYFPAPAKVQGLREARSGTWRDINKFEREGETLTRHYLTLWLEHGIDPIDASYAYMLLPNRSADGVKRYAEAPSVEVLANTAEVHAVRHRELGITGLHSWIDGGVCAGGIRVNGQASVMVMARDGRIEAAVSDPTFRGAGTIRIELEASAAEVLSCDPAVTVEALQPSVRLVVDVSGASGRTFHIALKAAESFG